MQPSQRSRYFLLGQGQPASNHVLFVFRFTCPTKKPIRRNNAITASHCRVTFFRSSWTTQRRKGVFRRQTTEILYRSSLSRYSWVLAANDCWFQVKYFLQRSSSFSLASASRVLHDNESWHACQRAYLTNTYKLNSYDSGTRAWADVHAKKPVPQRCSSIAFDFLDLSSSNLLHESSVDI